MPIGDDGRLAPPWTHAIAGGRLLVGGPALDGAGNLYWLESDATGVLELASLAPDGTHRLRTAVAPPDERFRFRRSSLAVRGEDVLVAFETAASCPRDAVVEARRAADGVTRWRRVMGDGAARVNSACIAEIGPLAASDAAIVAQVRTLAGGAQLRTVDAWSEDGEVLWSYPTDGGPTRPDGMDHQPRAAVDEDGNVYVTTPRLLSLSPSGELRFRGSGPSFLVDAVASGALLVTAADGLTRILEAASGREVASLGSLGVAAVAGNALFGVSSNAVAVDAVFGVISTAHLVRASLGAGQEEWATPLASPPPGMGVFRAGPILTAAGTLLVVEQQWALDAGPYPAELREVDVAGHDVASVELSGVDGVREALLGDGWLYVVTGYYAYSPSRPRIHAFPLPGRAPAPHGWISPQGSMARDGRARAP